jgi:hypothetical protein
MVADLQDDVKPAFSTFTLAGNSLSALFFY